MKSFFLFLLFLSSIHAIEVNVIKNFPNEWMSGKNYTAEFYFNSDLSGYTYDIIIEFSNITGEEFKFYSENQCNYTNNSYLCTNTLLKNANYPILIIQTSPLLAPIRYNYIVYFNIPYAKSNPKSATTHSYNSGSGGGPTTPYPAYPHVITSNMTKNNQTGQPIYQNNTTSKNKNLNISNNSIILPRKIQNKTSHVSNDDFITDEKKIKLSKIEAKQENNWLSDYFLFIIQENNWLSNYFLFIILAVVFIIYVFVFLLYFRWRSKNAKI